MVHTPAMRENHQKHVFAMDSLRVVPMRLFATWDVDRTSSNCVPRLFSMALNRLTIFKALEPDLTSIVVALKLQGYKRTLRSNDIAIQFMDGTADVDLDISFTLQYPHFIKKRNNCLLVMLQRRKKYKGRPLPGGFKTLALGMINLTEVLQSSTVVKDIPLYSDLTDVELNDVTSPSNSTQPFIRHSTQQATGKLYLHVLNSQPLENDDSKAKDQPNEFTDEEDDDSTANEDGGGCSDSEPTAGASIPDGARTSRSTTSKSNFPAAKRLVDRQKNLKQKFAAILKKFKIPEEEVLKAVDSNSQQPTEQEIRDLFDELDNYSNSDQELDADSMSVQSIPKPSLQPYFSSLAASRELLPTVEKISKESEESKDSGGDSQPDLDITDHEFSDVNATSMNGATAEPNMNAVQAKMKNASGSGIQREPLRMVATLPGVQRVERKREAFPSNRQASADVFTTVPASMGDHKPLRQQSLVERAAVARLRAVGKSGDQLITQSPSAPMQILAHKPITEQLLESFPVDDTNLVPDIVLIISAFDVKCQSLVDYLRERVTTKLLVVSSQADVKAIFNAVVNRMQKFCNTNAFQSQNAVKLGLIGGDRFFAYCLKAYTEIFAQKSNEWLHYVRAFVMGPHWSIVCRYLTTFDHLYATLFNDGFWRDWWDKTSLSSHDTGEIANRIVRFLQTAKLTLPVPIAEAMLQLKDKGTADEMSHIFVPFVVEVRKAAGESTSGEASGDSVPHSPLTGGQIPGQSPSTASPPPGIASGGYTSTPRGGAVPTGEVFSPTMHNSPPGSPHFFDRSNVGPFSAEAQDLQVEYWTPAGVSSLQPSIVTQKKESATSAMSVSSMGATGATVSNMTSSGSSAPTKYSLKTAFKSLVITRLPLQSSLFNESPSSSPLLMVQFVRERKKDKMLQKLGMKNKEKIESEQKCQSIEGINRLICSAKQGATMRLIIDGVEWTNVKFFQISSQWQTHVKVIPIALFHMDS